MYLVVFLVFDYYLNVILFNAGKLLKVPKAISVYPLLFKSIIVTCSKFGYI